MDIFSIPNIFNTEKRRATLVKWTTETIVFISHYVIIFYQLEHTQLKAMASLFVMLLQYTLDIFIAKSFVESALRAKAVWFARSFLNFNFFKYVLVRFIDYVTSDTILQMLKPTLDNMRLTHKYRDIIIPFVVNMFSFALYKYFLVFKWAYADNNDPITNILVMCFLSITIVLYMVSKKCKHQPTKKM